MDIVNPIEALKSMHSTSYSDTQWLIVDVRVNYSCDSVYCSHCNEQIEPSYCD